MSQELFCNNFGRDGMLESDSAVIGHLSWKTHLESPKLSKAGELECSKRGGVRTPWAMLGTMTSRGQKA